MSADWQDLAAGAAVLGAAAYLGLAARRWLRRSPAGGCGTACGSCHGATTAARPLMGIALPARPDDPEPGDKS